MVGLAVRPDPPTSPGRKEALSVSLPMTTGLEPLLRTVGPLPCLVVLLNVL